MNNAATAMLAAGASDAQPAACPACDPRIARSREALRVALIGLMEERGFDGFTVGDLCQRAGLNRGTFYNHFHDKDNLLKTFEDQILSDLHRFQVEMKALEIKDLVKYRRLKKPLPVLVELFSYLRNEGDFLHAVIGSGGDASFGPRLRTVVCDGFVRSLLHERYQDDESPFVAYYVAYFAGAYLGVISSWIESGMKESPEDMALICMRLLFIRPGQAIKM